MRTDTIEANHRAMQRVARGLLSDPEAADDAVQDAWVAALGRRGEPLGRGWFRTVVRRLAWTRRGAREHDRLAEDPVDDRGTRSNSAGAAALCAAIDALPPQYREVLEHRYWADEPPRVIAQGLGVDVRVVRNRLHRAHLQLRARLERSEGRGGVHSMLVALAGPLRLRGGAGAAAAAATAGGTKVAVAGAVAALLIAALVAVEILRSVPGDGRGPGPGGPESGAREGSVDAASLSPLEDGADGGGRAEIASRADGALASGPDAAEFEGGPGAGAPEWIRLELEVRDRATGLDVEDFTLAFRAARQAAAHATEYVPLPGAKVREGLFTAGTYSMVVRASGYDDRDLGEIELTEGPVHDLGTVDLDRGSAVVEGRVVGPGAADLSRLVVTATGSGRWTCVECDAAPRGMPSEPPHRCAACGYDGVDTVVAPDPATGAFTLDQLVGGPLRLVVSDVERGHLVASRVVAVPPATTIGVEVSIETKDVIVELVDAEGEPFDGAWLEDPEVFRAPILFHLWSDDIISARAEIDPGAVGLSLGDVTDGEVVVEAKRDLTGDLEATDGGTALEELWPNALPVPQGVLPKAVPAERVQAGRFLLRSVPASVDSVQVGCGLFVESPVRVRSERGAGEGVRIVVDDRCGVSARDVLTIEGVTCTSCHRAQGM